MIGPGRRPCYPLFPCQGTRSSFRTVMHVRSHINPICARQEHWRWRIGGHVFRCVSLLDGGKLCVYKGLHFGAGVVVDPHGSSPCRCGSTPQLCGLLQRDGDHGAWVIIYFYRLVYIRISGELRLGRLCLPWRSQSCYRRHWCPIYHLPYAPNWDSYPSSVLLGMRAGCLSCEACDWA